MQNDNKTLPLQDPDGGETINNRNIYRIEVEFLKAFAHTPDAAGLYALNLNLMPSNFHAALATKFLYAALFKLYSENKAITFKDAYDFLNSQHHLDKTHAEIVGPLLEEIFTLTGAAGEKPVESDVKTLIYNIKENGFKNDARKILTSSVNKLNHEKGDYVNTVKKSAESLLSLLEASSAHTAANSEVDIKALNIELELKAQKGGRAFPGLDTGFEILNGALNGVENEFYLIGAASSMGKTTFTTQLAFQLLKQNPELNLVFFSLDQSQKDILIKFVSAASGVPVKYLKCPSPKNESHELKKKDGIAYVTTLAKRMKIIDESYGDISIKDFKNIIRKFKLEFYNKPVIVIVDTVLAIRPCHTYNDKASEINDILAEIKTLVRTENIALIGTFNLNAEAETGRPKRRDVSEIPAFLYQPYAMMTLYSDFIVSFETPFLEWEWGTDDAMVPIVELDIMKNKMNGFKGKIFYRYFDSLAAFKECVEEENDNYRAMIENVEHYQTKRGNRPVPQVAPPPPPIPNIRINTDGNGKNPAGRDQSNNDEDMI